MARINDPAGEPLSLGSFYQGDTNIVCAHCGFDHLHRTTLKDWDAEAPVTTLVRDGKGRWRQSTPRQFTGLAINFQCERCKQHSELVIRGHKGVEVATQRKSK